MAGQGRPGGGGDGDPGDRGGAWLSDADGERLQACVMSGGVAVIPTDTVYGVCCDPDEEAAVRRLYELKGRPPERPAAVMFFGLDAALAALPGLAGRELAAVRALLPGGVTLLLANRARRYLPACGPDPDTLGIRVPLLAGALEGLAAASGPVMQSSANLSGGPDPRALDQVPTSIRDGARLVLDGGPLPGMPSTVVDLRSYADGGGWRLLREGAVTAGAVARALGYP